MLKKIGVFCAVALCSFLFITCGSDDDSDSPSLNGTWKVTSSSSFTVPYEETENGVTYSYDVYYNFSKTQRREYYKIVESSNKTLVPIDWTFYHTNKDELIDEVDDSFIYYTDDTYSRYILNSNTLRIEHPTDSTKYMIMEKVDDSVIDGAVANAPQKSSSFMSNNSIKQSILKTDN